MWRYALGALGVLVVSLPVSMVLTFVMLPIWGWLEERHGIASVGHSGPAEWCFEFMFALCVLIIGSLFVAILVRARRESPIAKG